ncbi:hypothetical protein [Streptococcus suis]|uniref:hypothetical protein n=1 Tax=Streptococcus suis TaxID=1307 RepID=UPI003F8C0831
MARISVSNLSGLSNFGSSISRFSDNYRSAIGSTYRSFQMKVDGEQAEAISAFLGKLNQVQATVFDTYPTVLDSYAQAISHYEDRLRGLGFQTKAWTDDAGASSVSGKLTGEQIDHIQEVKNKLQSAMNQASDALDISDFSLNGKVSGMEANLMEAGRRRTEMDQRIQEAYESFMRDLDVVIQNFESLKGPLANAQSVIQIPVASITTAIQNGSLAAGEVVPYLDAVTSKTDAQALEAIIGPYPGDVMAVNPNAISDSMYSVVAEEINQWTAQGEVAKLNHLTVAMSVNDVGQNDIFTNRILIVEDIKAVTLLNQMHQLYQNKPVYPDGGSAKEIADYQAQMALYEIEMEAYEHQLETLNKGTGLVNSLQFLRIGISKEKKDFGVEDAPDIHDYTQIGAKISIDKGDGITFEVHRNHLNSIYGTPTIQMWNNMGQRKSEEYISSLGESRLSSLGGEVDQRLFELKQERIEAKKELTSNTIESIVKGTISLHPYGAMALQGAEALASLSGMDKADAASKGKAFADSSYEKIKELYKNKTGQDLEPETIQKYSQVTSKGLDVAIEILGHQQQFEQLMGELDKKGDEATKDFLKLLFDQGGWSISTDTDDPFGQLASEGQNGSVYPSKSVTSTSSYYDFNAYQRLREFDDHGLTKFAEEQKVEIEDLSDKLTTNDPELRAYLLGQETYLDPQTQTERPVDLSLATMSADQVVDFIEAAKEVGDEKLEPLNKYMENHYGDTR